VVREPRAELGEPIDEREVGVVGRVEHRLFERVGFALAQLAECLLLELDRLALVTGGVLDVGERRVRLGQPAPRHLQPLDLFDRWQQHLAALGGTAEVGEAEAEIQACPS
jgi:hypothetical protein